MFALNLRQNLLLWGLLSILILVTLLLGQLFPAKAQVLLGTSEGVYLQVEGHNYYFSDEAALPQWSPDGEWVALQAELQLLITDDMSRVQYNFNLSENEQFTYRPVWSLNSQEIAFVVEEADETYSYLLLLNQQTGQLTNYPLAAGDIVLLWWEATNTIRFVTVQSRKVQSWRYNLAESAPQILQTWDFSAYLTNEAVLNPDNQSFILPAISSNLQNYELYQFNSDGIISNLSNRPSHNDNDPIWSPDAQFLAYRAISDGKQFILLRNLNGEEEQIASFDGTFIRDMQWLDERTISFINAHSGQSSLCSLDIFSKEISCSEPSFSFASLSWRPH